jgi:hypothetical protein
MITEILLKVALNTIIWHKPTYQFVTGKLIDISTAIATSVVISAALWQ